MGKSLNLPKEVEDKIVYNYTELKMGLRKAGSFVPVGHTYVTNLLKRRGIKTRTIQEANINKYNINHNFFQTQNHDMAYWIGMLASDGCVAGKSNQIYIELQRSDKELLEKMNESIENERPVKDYIAKKNNYENSKLYFYSKQIKKDLAEYNIIPNKTYNPDYGPPTKLREDFLPDYIRGIFDGDGSIKMSGKQPCFQIDTSCLEVARFIQLTLKKQGFKAGITSIFKVHVMLYRVYVYTFPTLTKLYDYIYNTPSDLFLKRKKKRFEEIIF